MMMTGGSGTDHQKVPFWIGTDCKVVSGINKSTTCQDVIRSLVHSSQDSSKFAIVEKWRKMERRLDPSVRILKVWKAWGDQKNDVTLILRQHHSADGYIDKRASGKVLRRKSSFNHKISNQVAESDDEVGPMKESMEHLLKLVLTQGETIQAQLKKLRHQEEQIERFEERMHRVRSLQDGENYVVESYLRDEKSRKASRKRDKSPRKHVGQSEDVSPGRRQPKTSEISQEPRLQPQSSSSDGITAANGVCPIDSQKEAKEGNQSEADVESITIIQQNEMLERICEVNTQLTREEERLLKLGFKLRKLQERRTTSTETCPTVLSSMSVSPEESIDFQVLTELEILRSVTSEQAKEIERNEESLTQLEQFLDAKQDHVTHLGLLMEQLDQESEFLKQRLEQVNFQREFDPRKSLVVVSSLSQPTNPTASSSPSSEDSLPCQCLHSSCSNHISDGKKICKDLQDNDSNSDTGISSLHSSGDEHTNSVLDTLV